MNGKLLKYGLFSALLLVAFGTTAVFRPNAGRADGAGSRGKSLPVESEQMFRLTGVHAWRFAVADGTKKVTLRGLGSDKSPNGFVMELGLAKPAGRANIEVLVVLHFDAPLVTEANRMYATLTSNAASADSRTGVANPAKGSVNHQIETAFKSLEDRNVLMTFNDKNGNPSLYFVVDFE